MAARFQLVELSVDRRGGQALRVGDRGVGRLGRIQLGRRLRQPRSERGGLLHPLVEGHHGLEVVARGMLQERGLE